MFEGMGEGDKAQAIYLAIILVVVLAGSAVLRRQSIGRTLSMLLIWVAIFGLIAFTANRREDVLALLGETDPAVASSAPGGGVAIKGHADGHFWVRATINGEPTLFLVDTGASDVVLSQASARAAGIDVDNLSYDRAALTANGTVRGATVRLKTIDVGGIVRSDMPATVTQGPLDTNLLGMRFLRSLSGWRVERDTLVLQP
jgi:aspartyl protease family protein